MLSKRTFLLFGLLPALFFQVLGAYFYFDVWAEQPLGKIIYLVTKTLLVLWPLFWWKALKTPLSIRPKKLARDLAYGMGSGLLLSLGLVLVFLILPNKEVLASQVQSKAEAYLNLNLQFFLLFSIFLSLAHSLLEEYYWRWFTAKGLEQTLKPLPAILVANLAFAAHHFIVLSSFVNFGWACFGTFGVFLGGLVWSRLQEKTGTLFASWISHACVDATIMGIGYHLLF